jgi:hypothetical protein
MTQGKRVLTLKTNGLCRSHAGACLSILYKPGVWVRGRGIFAICSGAVLEAPGLVAGLNDLAVMGEPVQEGRRHLGVAEDGRLFAEGEVSGDDDRTLFIEAADQMAQQLAAADPGALDRDGKVGLAGPDTGDEDDVALVIEEVATPIIPGQR